MDSVKVQLGMTDRTTQAIGETLARRRTTGRANLLFAGPAVIASIAYMDPGNFATNFQAGARYGYALLWVVLGVNVAAMLFQALSARPMPKNSKSYWFESSSCEL
jgi:manganese transport protein